jgi:hypothetical protein
MYETILSEVERVVHSKVRLEVLKKKFPPGLVGIVSGDTLRHVSFSQSLISLELPDGSDSRWAYGGNVAHNCNVLLEIFRNEPEFKWLWLIGDDHDFGKDVVLRLLCHNVDVVVPFCLRRKPPFSSVIHAGPHETIKGAAIPLHLYDLTQQHGLIKVWSVGQAGMLLTRKVVETVPGPWFQLGQVIPDKVQEDLFFCSKLREYNIDIHVDLDTHIGHSGGFIVYPARLQDGRWGFKFKFDRGTKDQIVIDPDGNLSEELVKSDIIVPD